MKRFLFIIYHLSFIIFSAYFIPKAFAQCAVTPGPNGCPSVDTAIGPISTNPGAFVGSIMGILLSLSGGVAILLIIASGYQFAMSRGNPEKVKEARERLTSAIVGLLFIIFSVVILQFIGVNLLQIPGFSK